MLLMPLFLYFSFADVIDAAPRALLRYYAITRYAADAAIYACATAMPLC